MAASEKKNMTDRHKTHGDSCEAHSAKPRLNPPGRLLTMHIIPPLLVLRELIRYGGRILPETWNRFIFHRFWGEGILSTNAHFLIDSYADVRLSSLFRRLGPHPAGALPHGF